MEIRKMIINDYEDIYNLWISCKGMGLNNLDDSKYVHNYIAKLIENNRAAVYNRKNKKEVNWGDERSKGKKSLTKAREEEDQEEVQERMYGEFDPGSGWTLAAGLIHASWGAAWYTRVYWWRPADGWVIGRRPTSYRGIA